MGMRMNAFNLKEFEYEGDDVKALLMCKGFVAFYDAKETNPLSEIFSDKTTKKDVKRDWVKFWWKYSSEKLFDGYVLPFPDNGTLKSLPQLSLTKDKAVMILVDTLLFRGYYQPLPGRNIIGLKKVKIDSFEKETAENKIAIALGIDEDLLDEIRECISEGRSEYENKNELIKNRIIMVVAASSVFAIFAPVAGAAVGAAMGFHGIVATNAGLAAMGFGSIASGGLGMAGGTALITSTGALLGLGGGQIYAAKMSKLSKQEAIVDALNLESFFITKINTRKYSVQDLQDLYTNIEESVHKISLTRDDIELKRISKNTDLILAKGHAGSESAKEILKHINESLVVYGKMLARLRKRISECA